MEDARRESRGSSGLLCVCASCEVRWECLPMVGLAGVDSPLHPLKPRAGTRMTGQEAKASQRREERRLTTNNFNCNCCCCCFCRQCHHHQHYCHQHHWYTLLGTLQMHSRLNCHHSQVTTRYAMNRAKDVFVDHLCYISSLFLFLSIRWWNNSLHPRGWLKYIPSTEKHWPGAAKCQVPSTLLVK